ncbi:MAG TPA: hypothetical protein PKJ93_06470 [Methanoculleus sp.]|nr:hypothetical protein [Methanoculleus sp.]
MTRAAPGPAVAHAFQLAPARECRATPDSFVSQAEHTLIVTADGCEVTTR